jgi:hypothetical protein
MPTLGLSDLSYAGGKLEYPSHRATAPLSALRGYVREADEIVAAALREYRTWPVTEPPAPRSADFEMLRWFPLAEECLAEALGHPGAESRRNPIHLRE